MGDVKVATGNRVHEAENLRALEKVKVDKETGLEVVRFVITNVDVQGVRVFKVDNDKVAKIISGDDEVLIEELRRILRELTS